MGNQEIEEHLLPDAEVEDESEKDRQPAPIVYNITSFGADYDVAGLVNRMSKGDITIPPFQRAFVWDQDDASSFVESLLLGLPVPGIFLAAERTTNKMMVIDGQQRLRSLQFFYDGFFDPKPGEEKKKVFKLTDVQPQFEGQTYQTLTEKDRRRLDDAIIHATIIKQDSPKDGDTSIYHIFHRLNASGMILKPQEIRRAAFNGSFLSKITELNDFQTWRSIFGKKNKRLKDEELILRFLALHFDSDDYKKPMEEFLSFFASTNQKADALFLSKCDSIFKQTIDVVAVNLGESPFRIKRGINAAVFDSVMVALARRLADGPIGDGNALKRAYEDLFEDVQYVKAITDGTSDEAAVDFRIEKATEVFSSIH